MQLPCHSQEVSPGSTLQSQPFAVMIICTLSEVLRKKQQQSEAKEAAFPKGSMSQVKVVEGEGLRNAHSAFFERPMVTESLGEGTQHCPRLMESGGLKASISTWTPLFSSGTPAALSWNILCELQKPRTVTERRGKGEWAEWKRRGPNLQGDCPWSWIHWYGLSCFDACTFWLTPGELWNHGFAVCCLSFQAVHITTLVCSEAHRDYKRFMFSTSLNIIWMFMDLYYLYTWKKNFPIIWQNWVNF